MVMFLTLLSGIGWMIVYEECIRLGFKDKTFALPLWALGLNFAWEVICAFADIVLKVHGTLEGMVLAQTVVNVFWAGLDMVILYTFFRFGKKEWPNLLPKKYFVPYGILVLVCSFALQIVFIQEFGFVMACQYSAFLQNLLMSVLFIGMYIKRGNMEGQSLLLAVAKWIGTLAPTILMGVLVYNPVVMISGVFCSIFDLIYITLLVHHKMKNPVATI